MSSWAVPLLVAAIAAAATLATAYIANAKDRKNVREHILKDLEFAEKLEDEQAKSLLQQYIRARVLILPLEGVLRFVNLREWLDVVIVGGVLGATLVAHLTHTTPWRYFLAFGLFEVMGVWYWRGFRRAQDKRIREYAAEDNISMKPLDPTFLQRWKAWRSSAIQPPLGEWPPRDRAGLRHATSQQPIMDHCPLGAPRHERLPPR